MVKQPQQGDVYLVCLDPTQGSEINKTRPALIVSPDELNRYLHTVIAAPLTSTVKPYPFRVNAQFAGRDSAIALDQMRAVDKSRLVKKLGSLPMGQVLDVLQRMFSP